MSSHPDASWTNGRQPILTLSRTYVRRRHYQYFFANISKTKKVRHFRKRKKLFQMFSFTTYSKIMEIGDRG